MLWGLLAQCTWAGKVMGKRYLIPAAEKVLAANSVEPDSRLRENCSASGN